MKWDRQTIKTVAIVFLTVIVTSFFITWTFDHEGETVTLGGDPEPTAAPATGAASGIESGDTDPESGLPWVLEEKLPVTGQATLALIDQGGPYPFPGKDGSTFGNFEGLLPDHARGYYAEYTVVTPGSADRGPLRVVAGDGGEFYWTEDHYESFDRILRRGG
jgi:ribonuclease T1